MGAKNSFASLAEQVIKNNKNSLEIMAKLDQVVSSNNSNVDVTLLDETGNPIVYSFPTVGYLKAELDRISANINTLSSISANGSFIRDADNSFKKIIVADLNKEPNSLTALNSITDFRSDKNWFFDALLNPILSIVIDLNNKIENNVRKCFVRRYIVRYNSNEDGTLTALGDSARNSFNGKFINRINISVEEFENWHATTPGVQNPTTPLIDEQLFDLEPNTLLYDGTFTVNGIEEDTINKKLWYLLNSISYLETINNTTKDLSIGDEVIINNDISTTRYKVVEVSTASSIYRVRFERLEGFEPIPVGVKILKIYSPLVLNKNVKISVGFNEYNVTFVKPMNTDNHLLAKSWSLGTAYYTNNLRLVSNDVDNGVAMPDYYVQKVYDYGLILQDLVAKKKPNSLGITPNVVVLKEENFKVVQINKHLTDSIDVDEIRNKNNQKNTIKSQIDQIDSSLQDKQRELQTRRFTSDADRLKSQTQLQDLVNKKDSSSKLLTSTVTEILSLSKNLNNVAAKFKVRGFWDIPEPVQAFNVQSQEVIGFIIQYKYQSKSGSENPVENFKIISALNPQNIRPKDAFFSNWVEIKSDIRKRTYNANINTWTWSIEDVSNADTPNINQLDIPILAGEKIEIRIKSISEVGYPEAPIVSDWSKSLIIVFPEDLNKVLGENEFILKEASQEDQRIKFQNDLNSKGLGQHLGDSITVVDKYYPHKDESILTHFQDNNNNLINLKDYLDSLTNRILALEEQLKRAKGELRIRIFRGTQEYVVQNGGTVEFNIECEDYGILDTVAPAPRKYIDFNVYKISDFKMTIENIAVESPLGLISNRKYIANPNNPFHDEHKPQALWVNTNDQLMLNEYVPPNTVSRMQKDNQWIWLANIDKAGVPIYARPSGNLGFTDLSNTVIQPFLNGGNSLVAGPSSTADSNKNVGFAGCVVDAIFNPTNIAAIPNTNSLVTDITDNNLWKWLIGSPQTDRFGITVHPSSPTLNDLVASTSDGLKIINAGKDGLITVPLNIYFKYDVNNFTFGNTITLGNGSIARIYRTRFLRFYLEPETSARAFDFTIKFNFYNKRTNLVQTVIPNVNLV